jgi:hypothetical protein
MAQIAKHGPRTERVFYFFLRRLQAGSAPGAVGAECKQQRTGRVGGSASVAVDAELENSCAGVSGSAPGAVGAELGGHEALGHALAEPQVAARGEVRHNGGEVYWVHEAISDALVQHA